MRYEVTRYEVVPCAPVRWCRRTEVTAGGRTAVGAGLVGPAPTVSRVVRGGGQLVVTAVSSMTKEVWRLESSVPVNFRVTVLPA
jgi:hypothetical protein